MPYRRKYDYKGIEPLLDNALRILERDMPAELALIAEETGSEVLQPFAEYLRFHKDSPELPCIVVVPDVDDALEANGANGLSIVEENTADITIVGRMSDDLDLLTTEIMRYKRAARNVLWSADENDLLLGINHFPAAGWDIRGGRYTQVLVQNQKLRAVVGMKLIATYEEVANA
jgi:hypothetical protein